MWDNTYPWNAPQNGYKPYPTRVISSVDILELNGEQQTLIGKTMDYVTQLESTCQQAIETAEKHYSRLVDLGDIVPPKSQEDALREQSLINDKLIEAIDGLKSEMKELRNSNSSPDEKTTENTSANPKTKK